MVAPPRTPAVEVVRAPEPEEDEGPTKVLEEKSSRGTTGRAADIGDDGASPSGGSPGESLARTEDNAPSDCAPLGYQGGGGDCANGWNDAAEKCEAGGYEVVQGDVSTDQRSPDPIEVEAGGDGGENKGSAAPNSRVDLGMEDDWFQKLEAKMGAIKKQVRVRRSAILLRFYFSYTQLVSATRWGGCRLPAGALPKLGKVARVHVLPSAVGILRLAAGRSQSIPTFINRFVSPHFPNITSARRLLSYHDPRKVDQIQSPAFSTPRRRDESRQSANRRGRVSPRSYDITPPPNGMGRDDHQRFGDRVDKEVDGSIDGERRVLQSSPRQPTCTPPTRDAKQHGEEGEEQLSRHSGENTPSTPVVGGNKAARSADGVQRPNGQSAEPVSAPVSSFRPADASSPSALHGCSSQQPRLLAAAAAIEAAVVSIAAIPKVSNV